MNRIKIKIISLMMVLVVILTGCVDEEINMVINADGSSTYTVVQKIDKAKFGSQCTANGMKQSDINECYQLFEKSGYKLQNIDGTDYFVQSTNGKSKKGELSKQFKAYDEDAYASVNAIYFVLDMKNIPEVAELVAEAEDCGVKLGNDAVTLTINIEFPYTVVRTTGKIDPDNPKKVSFTANLGNKITVFASTKDSITQKSFAKPGKLKIKSLKAKRSSNGKSYANISFSTSDLATKYQVQYTKRSNNTGYKTVTTKKHYAKIKKLSRNTKYYFRVRAARKLYNGRTVYGKWTKKTVVTPK